MRERQVAKLQARGTSGYCGGRHHLPSVLICANDVSGLARTSDTAPPRNSFSGERLEQALGSYFPDTPQSFQCETRPAALGHYPKVGLRATVRVVKSSGAIGFVALLPIIGSAVINT